MKNKNVLQPEGNYFDKYNSSNPIVKKIMSGFFSAVGRMLNAVGEADSILEAGCGEGEVTAYLSEHYKDAHKIEAFDISEKVVQQAKEKCSNVKFSTGNIYNISGSNYELVVCCEVLEHLDQPGKALEELKRVSDQYVLVSVPREPIWCMLNLVRGKYIRHLGNTPGHIQHWSSRKFIKFVKQSGMKIVCIEKPLPWTMVLLKKE